MDSPRELLVGDASRIVYAVDDQNQLRWNRLAADGAVWDANSGSVLATVAPVRSITSLGFGVVLVLDEAGSLTWFRDIARDGTRSLSAKSGRTIAEEWQAEQVVGMHSGHVLAIDPNGATWWYQWLGDTWHPASGSVQLAEDLVAPGGACWAGNDTVLALTATGEVRAHDIVLPAFVPFDAGPVPRLEAAVGVATGMVVSGAVVALGADELLVVREDGTTGVQGVTEKAVGPSLGYQVQAAVAGDPLSVVATAPFVDAYIVGHGATVGEKVAAAISVRTPAGADDQAVRATLVRLGGPSEAGARSIELSSIELRAERQSLPSSPWRDGCAWKTTEIDIPVEATSGLHALRLDDGTGDPLWLPVPIRPAVVEPGRIAVLANTNTWNAYNAWAGISQYTNPNGEVLSFHRPQRWFRPDGQLSDDRHEPNAHLLAGEMEVIGVLDEADIAYDVWTDHDLHSGALPLAQYRALLLSTHPEYWTNDMFDRLAGYLDGGGNLINVGANGVYERVAFNDDGSALVLRDGEPEGRRDLLRYNGRGERALLGVAFEARSGDAALTYAPYRVEQAGHPFFEGTDLADGSLFATDDNLRGGAGWEVDSSFDDGDPESAGPAPANLQILARGTLGEWTGQEGRWNPDTNAHMTYYDHPGGGFVFSVGSIAYGHWMRRDARAARVVVNAVNRALVAA